MSLSSSLTINARLWALDNPKLSGTSGGSGFPQTLLRMPWMSSQQELQPPPARVTAVTSSTCFS